MKIEFRDDDFKDLNIKDLRIDFKSKVIYVIYDETIVDIESQKITNQEKHIVIRNETENLRFDNSINPIIGWIKSHVV